MSTSVSLGTVTDHHPGYGARPRICHRGVRHWRSGPNRTNWARRPQNTHRTSARAGCTAPTGSTGRGGAMELVGRSGPTGSAGGGGPAGLPRPRWTDGTLLICMVVSFGAIAVAGHRRAGRVDGHTRARGNFLGTMIPYASAMVALPLPLAFAHVLVGEVLPLGVADLGLAGHLLAVNAAVHLPVVAAWADVEQPEAGSAALLAERLHLGARDVEKLAPRREG